VKGNIRGWTRTDNCSRTGAAVVVDRSRKQPWVSSVISAGAAVVNGEFLYILAISLLRQASRLQSVV
jgi:hypothetical protein